MCMRVTVYRAARASLRIIEFACLTAFEADAGDTHITLAQCLHVHGAVMVTTPQEVALSDVRRSLSLFKTVNIPILGVVENMSHHVCSNCGHVSAIFGSQGGSVLAAAESLPLLGCVPLESALLSGRRGWRARSAVTS